MGTLGTYFRNAREARGLDLRDAAQQTRISINYLKALEEEDFSKLPGEVFVKGFLKNYARFLRLPEEEVVRRYGECTQCHQGAASTTVAKAESSKQGQVDVRAVNPEVIRPADLNLEPFLWGAIILAGFVLFMLVAMPSSRPAHEQDQRVSTQTTATVGLHTGVSVTAKNEKLYLDIIALEDVWVLVRTDASPQKKAVLKKGERITWSADERFLLSYANAGSLKILLNGTELTVNGPKNAVVRDLMVTAKGITFQKTDTEQPLRPRRPKPQTQATSTAPAAVPPATAPPSATNVQPSSVSPTEPLIPPRE